MAVDLVGRLSVRVSKPELYVLQSPAFDLDDPAGEGMAERVR
jgi:hypothetical protein